MIYYTYFGTAGFIKWCFHVHQSDFSVGSDLWGGFLMPGFRRTPSGVMWYRVLLTKNTSNFKVKLSINTDTTAKCNVCNVLTANKLVPAKPVSSATKWVKGLFLGNIIFLCQILHTDLQLLLFCSALPLCWMLPGRDWRSALESSHINQYDTCALVRIMPHLSHIACLYS